MNRYRTLLATLAAMLLATSLAGCASSGPRFVDEGNSYTADSVMGVLDTADVGSAAGQPTSKAAELRQAALVSLRKQGGGASAAADVLTRTFANSSPGVPYYVEKATFDDAEALVVAEVIGPKNGVLKDERIWVIDGSGAILYSATR